MEIKILPTKNNNDYFKPEMGIKMNDLISRFKFNKYLTNIHTSKIKKKNI